MSPPRPHAARGEWHSAVELAALALPSMPTTRQGVEAMAEAGEWAREAWRGTTWRPRAGRGGGVEYHVSALPFAAQAALALRARGADAPTDEGKRTAAWAWFERLPARQQDVARERLAALDAIEELIAGGAGRVAAAAEVARLRRIALSSIYNWQASVRAVARADWLPALAPRHAGRAGDAAECSAEAWEMLKADWLRPEQPSFSACYRRLQEAAASHGWAIPAGRTLERRLLALPEAMRVLARQGREALKRMVPAQERSRAALHALQVVNADGHKWDVFVRWPDGTVGRPVMLAIQDVFSGKILSWRVDRSENKETFRLCVGDLVEQWGIPDAIVLDNSRTFASKWIAGGTPTRFRFKVRDDEPLGVLVELGIAVHWATPYAGQSKPIERAFRDFAGDTAKHPAFAGAYVGNRPDAKPENYGKSAVPLDLFVATVGRAMLQHNARAGRTGGVCAGRSFDAVFDQSYQDAMVRRASAQQRRLWLLAAERVLVSRTDGHIALAGNRYFDPQLHEHRGQRVTVRFDPDLLQAPLHVYRHDGAYLCAAECVEAQGFHDAAAARRHAQARAALMRGVRMQLDAERSLSIHDVAALLPDAAPPAPPPAPRVVRPVFGRAAGNTALADRPEPAERHDPVPDELALARALRRVNPALRVHRDPDHDDA